MPAIERASVDCARSVEGAGGPAGAASRPTVAHSAAAATAATSETRAAAVKRRRIIGQSTRGEILLSYRLRRGALVRLPQGGYDLAKAGAAACLHLSWPPLARLGGNMPRLVRLVPMLVALLGARPAVM